MYLRFDVESDLLVKNSRLLHLDHVFEKRNYKHVFLIVFDWFMGQIRHYEPRWVPEVKEMNASRGSFNLSVPPDPLKSRFRSPSKSLR